MILAACKSIFFLIMCAFYMYELFLFDYSCFVHFFFANFFARLYVLFISFSLRYDSCCMYELFLFDCSCISFSLTFFARLYVLFISFWVNDYCCTIKSFWNEFELDWIKSYELHLLFGFYFQKKSFVLWLCMFEYTNPPCLWAPLKSIKI